MGEKNIFWQTGKVSYEDRCRLMGQKGLAVWFTGLSGAGKSTVAVAVELMLYEQGMKTYLLDGDNIRHGINSDLGFSDGDREENIRRISEITRLFCDAGMVTLVSCISPFSAMRESVRELVGSGRFIEVYVKTDIDVCMARDPKGLYAKNLNCFTGVTSVYEAPENPDVILDTAKLAVDESVGLVVDKIKERLENGQ